MYQRPKINETEDDILKQQEEFFKSNVKSSTKLIKKTEGTVIIEILCYKTKFNLQTTKLFQMKCVLLIILTNN